MTAVVDEPRITADTLVAITGEVFAALLGEDRGRPYACEPGDVHPIAARVRVDGDWHSTVIVACSRGLVTIAASELFGIDTDAVSDADLRDVVGEFANVIGGNVKSMLPGPSVLTLPETELTFDGTGTEVDGALRVNLTWCREHLLIVLTNPGAGRAD